MESDNHERAHTSAAKSPERLDDWARKEKPGQADHIQPGKKDELPAREPLESNEWSGSRDGKFTG